MNMRPMMLLVAWVALLSTHFALAKDDNAVKQEVNLLKGTWKLTKLEAAGVASNPKFTEKLVFIINDDTFTLSDGELNPTTKYKLNLATKPKQLDITPTEGPQKDKPVPGIYELNGEVLKICFSRDGQRPTTFATKTGENTVLMEMKKQPAK